MSTTDISRRLFLQGTGSLAGANALRASIPGLLALTQAACSARDNGEAFTILQDPEAIELDAITARIIPTTDTPGAHEAGVVWFIDKALGDFMAPQQGFLREGLAEFQAAIPALYPGVELFSELDEEQQDAYLGSQEQTPFFGFLRVLTLMGTFGLSSYGGNRNGVGWQLLGVDPMQHAHQPPFGFYDAQYRQGDSDGE